MCRRVAVSSVHNPYREDLSVRSVLSVKGLPAKSRGVASRDPEKPKYRRCAAGGTSSEFEFSGAGCARLWCGSEFSVVAALRSTKVSFRVRVPSRLAGEWQCRIQL